MPENVSKLYNLTPIGLNTPFIESLTSYVIRLAEEHCVITGTLIGKVITPTLDKHYLNRAASRGGGGLYKNATSLNGVSSGTKDLVDAVESLTLRNDLITTTLLNWSKVLPTRGLLRKHKAWCPLCIEEWLLNGKSIYEPLIWFINESDICLIHRVILETTCQNCFKKISTLSRNVRHGYCSNCGHWLGQNVHLKFLDDKKDYWNLWKTECIGEILENMPSLNENQLTLRIKNVLVKAIDKCFDGSSIKFIKITNIPRSTLNSWVDENSLPSMSYLLKVSFCLGVSLKQFLTEPLSSIGFSIRDFPYDNDVQNINYKRFPDGYIEKKLIYWSETNQFPPPSLNEIASMIGCDRKLLNKKSPELCITISQRYSNYITERSQQRIKSLKKLVSMAIETLNKNEVYPSRRKVEEFLKMPGLIKEESIRNFWLEKLERSKLQNK